ISGAQQNDTKRQHLLERLLDAVKQCQIRFGGRKEIASDSDSRVICLCAQFETVLQHGLRKSRGLALTAAAIKQAAGFTSKTEAELSFWLYVKEHLNRHELQRFYSLRHITSELGRGRAWLRCALNEHSLERYLHMLLADRSRLSVFYEDCAFLLDEERASMLPTMAAGLNSILFAINIDNTDLNGQTRSGPSVSNLLKESTQGVSSLWKESTQGVSTLLREISTATAVVPGFSPRSECHSDPLPVLPRSASADSGLRKERRRKKKITNIISFDDGDDGGAEDEEGEVGGGLKKSGGPLGSSEEVLHPRGESPTTNGGPEAGMASWGSDYTHNHNGALPDTKSIDNDEEDDDLYSKSRPEPGEEQRSGERCVTHVYFETFYAVNLVITSDIKKRFLSFPPHPPTTAELRQAIVAMMSRKDELEEQNISLRSLLDGEMEHSAGLRQEVDSLRKRLGELEERHTAKVQALARENEVLKVQLKKYVGAVQMLKREGGQTLPMLRNCDSPPCAPQSKSASDVEELASSYERKLIEVAEMHGELIEFNERLYRSLMAKDHLISQMRQELIELRGPVPGDLSQTSDDPSLSDFETTHRALINVWIPSVFLRGNATNAYHVYQVYIRILDNEWNVYRRYAEFRDLHNRLRSQYPQVDTFSFPPKKAIGNKDAKFVEERRKQLQCYLRMVMNKLVQTLPQFSAQPTKETLLQLLPFCRDMPQTSESGGKPSRSRSSRFPKLGRSQNRESRNPEPQSGDL
uniref:Sorting nexin 29 n=1 Tax=Scleropages formosus TaxID=113540 RepID=A0A8C9WKC8_SCLFO